MKHPPLTSLPTLAASCLLAAITLMSALAFSSGNLPFGAVKDIGVLTIKNESSDYSAGSFSQVVSMHVETEGAVIFKTRQNFDLLQLEGLTPRGEPGQPTIYSKPLELKLDRNARVTGVKLISGKYVELEQELNLAPRPKPHAWSKDIPHDPTLRKNDTIYRNDTLFPGKTVSFISGRNQHNTIVHVQLNVSQYNPVQKRLLLLTEAQIEISYIVENVRLENSFNPKATTEAANIIITDPAFSAAADSLKNLHETMEDVPTEVVTTDWINTNYSAADDPTTPGYATESSNPLNSHYNYELAKKIVAYLRDSMAHPNLTSITLLGDAEYIPPSYYFHIQVEDRPDPFADWIGSDLFYSSPDYDMVMNFGLGRLPATSLDEALLMFTKIKNWKTNLNATWFDNVQLVGGAAFATKLLFGEAITLDPVNKGYFQGMNIGKNYLTRGNLNSGHVLPYFSDENTGIFYHVGHGSIGMMEVGQDYVSSFDFTGLPAKEKYPIVVSIGCLCGSYDTELFESISIEFPCIAESVLLSQAGGIAYFGGVRYNYGGFDADFQDNGTMSIVRVTEMAAMFNGVFKSWSEGTLSFGTLASNARDRYVNQTGLSDSVDKLTLYEFLFFGDPALTLLPHSGTSFSLTDINVSPTPSIPGSDTPTVYNPPVYNYNQISMTGTTDSPSVDLSIFTVQPGPPVVFNQTVSQDNNATPYRYLFPTSANTMYMASFETMDSKETRLYFKVNTPEVVSAVEMAAHIQSLSQNYPNPFNPSTTFSFSLAEELGEATDVSIYDIRGQKIRTLVSEILKAGSHQVVWNGKNDRGEMVSSGTYFYKLKSGEYVATKKMTLLK